MTASLIILFIIQNFQNEFVNYYSTTMIDYHDFFNKYLMEDNQEVLDSLQVDHPRTTAVNVNNILQKLENSLRESNLNIHYAFKFFDQEQINAVHVSHMEEILNWFKCKLSVDEIEALKKHFRLKENESYINSEAFMNALRVSALEIVKKL